MNKKDFDLNSLDANSRIGILTGTFDPIHENHLNIARASLKFSFGDEGNDLVLLYAHSFSSNKVPADIGLRNEIIQHLINDDERLGILYFDSLYCENPKKPRELMRYLTQNFEFDYTRIIGSDKLAKAVKYEGHLPHFVQSRNGDLIDVPNHFYPLDVRKEISSTQIRSGNIPLSEDYGIFLDRIRSFHPHVRMA